MDLGLLKHEWVNFVTIIEKTSNYYCIFRFLIIVLYILFQKFWRRLKATRCGNRCLDFTVRPYWPRIVRIILQDSEENTDFYVWLWNCALNRDTSLFSMIEISCTRNERGLVEVWNKYVNRNQCCTCNLHRNFHKCFFILLPWIIKNNKRGRRACSVNTYYIFIDGASIYGHFVFS